ncbi:hypothetical protein BDV11DRAFT_178588 [Aspergillus similis]
MGAKLETSTNTLEPTGNCPPYKPKTWKHNPLVPDDRIQHPTAAMARYVHEPKVIEGPSEPPRSAGQHAGQGAG